MDALSELLRDLRVKTVLLGRGEFCAPWGIDKEAIYNAIPFHIVVEAPA